MKFTGKKFLKLSLCLAIFISLFAISVQAAENVKIGTYVNRNVDDDGFFWALTLNSDKTAEFVTVSFGDTYDNKGTWTSDNEGNVTIFFPEIGEHLFFTGGGSDPLTIWNVPLYYEDPSSYISFPLLPAEQTVSPTTSTVYINGEAKSFETYNIAGNNYFKLRDIAFVLNGTEKQFDIAYGSEANVITLTLGVPYTALGGEMSQGNGKAKTAIASRSTLVYHDRPLEPINLPAYNIEGSNYFKLTDLTGVLSIGIVYDDATKNIQINTDADYTGTNNNN